MPLPLDEISNPPAANGRNFRPGDRTHLQSHQLQRLNALLREILPRNRFWQAKLGGVRLPLQSLEAWSQVPMTTKDDLVRGVESDPDGLLTFPKSEYSRVHRTSGTHGNAMCVFDTPSDWRWWTNTWQYTLDAAQVTAEDRAALAFSFGPFIGFWSAHDALAQRGAMVIPTGGMASQARIRFFEQTRPTLLLATPSYALRLGEVASEMGINPPHLGISRIIVAGEPGGSIPTVRARLQSLWNAQIIDHAGATEVGPWGVGRVDGSGLEVIESEFIAEFIPSDPPCANDTQPPQELVLTALGRFGWPVLRYRTGDLVAPHVPNAASSSEGFVHLVGGILGRSDAMLVIRGMNVFPSSIEAVLRGFDGIGEFRVHIRRQGALDDLLVRVEDKARNPQRIAEQLSQSLGLRIGVEEVPWGSLDRFEGKAQRIIDERTADTT